MNGDVNEVISAERQGDWRKGLETTTLIRWSMDRIEIDQPQFRINTVVNPTEAKLT